MDYFFAVSDETEYVAVDILSTVFSMENDEFFANGDNSFE